MLNSYCIKMPSKCSAYTNESEILCNLYFESQISKLFDLEKTILITLKQAEKPKLFLSYKICFGKDRQQLLQMSLVHTSYDSKFVDNCECFLTLTDFMTCNVVRVVF